MYYLPRCYKDRRSASRFIDFTRPMRCDEGRRYSLRFVADEAAGSVPESICCSWRTKWQGCSFSSEYFGCLLSAITPLFLHIYLCVIWRMDNGPIGDLSATQTLCHPIMISAEEYGAIQDFIQTTQVCLCSILVSHAYAVSLSAALEFFYFPV